MLLALPLPPHSRFSKPDTPPTLEQLHGAQLEGDAVFLGEDVDGAAGLGQQVQVELQDHGGGGGHQKPEGHSKNSGGSLVSDQAWRGHALMGVGTFLQLLASQGQVPGIEASGLSAPAEPEWSTLRG